MANLKVVVEESENKFYNLGFANAENSSEPIMFQSRRYGFNEGWMVTVTAPGLGFPNPDFQTTIDASPPPSE